MLNILLNIDEYPPSPATRIIVSCVFWKIFCRFCLWNIIYHTHEGNYNTLEVVSSHSGAEPGFLVEGGANPPGRGANIQICHIFPKNCKKLRKFWSVEGRAPPLPHLDPPLTLMVHHICTTHSNCSTDVQKVSTQCNGFINKFEQKNV